jgi:hypothetical protein
VDFKAGNYSDLTIDFDTMGLGPVPDPKGAYPWSRYLGVLGGPGLTAFCGLEAYGDAKKVRCLADFDSAFLNRYRERQYMYLPVHRGSGGKFYFSKLSVCTYISEVLLFN